MHTPVKRCLVYGVAGVLVGMPMGALTGLVTMLTTHCSYVEVRIACEVGLVSGLVLGPLCGFRGWSCRRSAFWWVVAVGLVLLRAVVRHPAILEPPRLFTVVVPCVYAPEWICNGVAGWVAARLVRLVNREMALT